jgi:two-component system sensor histidine kinase QseC
VTVADRGPGLSPEQAEQAGRRFWRGDQGRQRQDGSGLGLSIVRAIAERFDAALTLQARDGGGLVTKLVVSTQAAATIRAQ